MTTNVILYSNRTYSASTVILQSSNPVSAVRADAHILWAQRALVSTNRTLLWEVLASAGTTSSTRIRWGVLANVRRSMSLVWEDRQLLSLDRTLQWEIRNTVGTTRSFVWDVHATASRSQSLLWECRQTVAADATIIWAIIGPVLSSMRLSWRVYAPYPPAPRQIYAGSDRVLYATRREHLDPFIDGADRRQRGDEQSGTGLHDVPEDRAESAIHVEINQT